MSDEDYASIETKCYGCGKNKFRLTRKEGSEVLAECLFCGHPHTIDSVLEEKTSIPLVYWFSAPKKMRRCENCRSPLKFWDISYDGRSAVSKCTECGLYHTFRKTRLRKWKLQRITHRIGDESLGGRSNLTLSEIDGIGEKRAETLRLAGVVTISDLADSSISLLYSKTNIPKKLLVKWITQAKKYINQN